jgi:hypothetical protein
LGGANGGPTNAADGMIVFGFDRERSLRLVSSRDRFEKARAIDG